MRRFTLLHQVPRPLQEARGILLLFEDTDGRSCRGRTGTQAIVKRDASIGQVLLKVVVLRRLGSGGGLGQPFLMRGQQKQVATRDEMLDQCDTSRGALG